MNIEGAAEGGPENGEGSAAGGARNGEDPEVVNGDGGSSGVRAWGVGGIKGRSVGAAVGAGRSTENTDWHFRQRTRAPCTGILSSAMT